MSKNYNLFDLSNICGIRDLSRGEMSKIIKQSQETPIVIQKNNKPISVMLNYDEYLKLTKNKTLKVFECFSGIGAQHSALERLKNKYGLNYEVVATCDWYINAIETYDAIHSDKNEEIKLPSRNKQLEYLSKFTFSKDFINAYDITKLNDKDLSKLYIANKRTNNLGSILDLDTKDLPSFDLLLYSPPCVSISKAGKMKGLAKNSNTKTSLIWEIERVLKNLAKENRLPEYLILENVNTLNAKIYTKDLTNWLNALNELGYYSSECMILNSKDFGVPQNRSRAFIVSHLNTPINISKNMLRTNHNYKLSDYIYSEQGNSLYKEEYIKAQLPITKSRLKMWETNKKEWSENLVVNTITCNLDRSNTSAMFKFSSPTLDSFRLLTIRECFLLMGFTNEEYEKTLKLDLSYREMNKLIGNSLVINVLEEILKYIFVK